MYSKKKETIMLLEFFSISLDRFQKEGDVMYFWVDEGKIFLYNS